mgnify:CR=1 FL=1
MRFAVSRKRFRAGRWLMVVILLSVVGAAFWIVESHLKPTLLAIAEAKATLIATETINNVINEKVSKEINTDKMINVRVDERGRVVLIQPNAMEFNRLAADTTIKVQDGLKAISAEKIYIPIGQVVGSQLMASWGPNIVVTIIPIGTVQVTVVDKFDQAGINQTRHLVYLMATTTVRIVVPLVSKSVHVTTQVPVAEYVVVGDVPNTYVQIPANILTGNGSAVIP